MDLTLHFPTLSLALFLVFLSNALFSLLLYLGHKTFSGAGFWVTGQFLLCFSLLMLGFRASLPAFFSIVINNSIYMVSLTLIIHSLWKFRFKRPFPPLIYLLCLGSLLTFVFFQNFTFPQRAAVFSGNVLVYSLLITGLLLYKLREPFVLSNILTALPFLLMGVFSLVRIVVNLSNASQEVDLTLGGVNQYFLLVSVLAAPLILFGFLMMNNQKVQMDLMEKDAQIEKRNRDLLESNRTKDLFFSVIAHDLRGPVGGSARYVRKNLLERRDILPEKRSEIEILAGSLDRTHEFLEKLLHWARSFQDAWEPRYEILNLGKTVNEVMTLLNTEFDLKDVKVSIPDPSQPADIRTDGESLKIILHNLLSNALKFSELGSEVLVDWREDKKGTTIQVTDFGVGLAQGDLSKLFRIEAKITSQGTRGEVGSGMGLILSQNLAHRVGGEITLDSPGPDQGATARLFLPKHFPGSS